MYTVSKERFEKFVDIYCAMVTKNYGNKYYFNSGFNNSYFKHQGSKYYIDIWTFLDEKVLVKWLKDGNTYREDGLAFQLWRQTEHGIFSLIDTQSSYHLDDQMWLTLNDYYFKPNYIILDSEPYNILCDKYKILTSDEVAEHVAVKQEIEEFGEFIKEINIFENK